jgi:voltage-gated potassium channel
VITLTSMGYGSKHAVSTGGRIFTMAMALGGIFTLAVVATEFLSTVITGEMRTSWRDRRMRKRIEALERHVIVCGYGKVGRRVCANLQRGGAPFIVIDRHEALLASARDMGAHALLGDATEDATLQRAGIGRARALIALAGTDADNLLIIMTARQLCPALPIVTRADEDAIAPKLQSAGATRTICPHTLVAARVTEAVLQPSGLDVARESRTAAWRTRHH